MVPVYCCLLSRPILSRSQKGGWGEVTLIPGNGARDPCGAMCGSWKEDHCSLQISQPLINTRNAIPPRTKAAQTASHLHAEEVARGCCLAGLRWEGAGGVEGSKGPVFMGAGGLHKSALGLGHLWCLQDAANQEGTRGCQVSSSWRSQRRGLSSLTLPRNADDSPIIGRCIPHQTRPDLHLRNRGRGLLALRRQLVLRVIPGSSPAC